MNDDWITTREALDLLGGINYHTLRRYKIEHVIISTKTGRTAVWPRSAIMALAEKRAAGCNLPEPPPVVGALWLPLVKRKGYALVDESDFERANQFSWSLLVCSRTNYAMSVENKRPLHLHRFILNAPSGTEVDHINHNGLDCRRENLRLCVSAQNNYNTQKQSRYTSSKYKGVSFYRRDFTWQAGIGVNGTRIYLGRFATELEAAHVYDTAARRYFGEFAQLNFPERA